MKPSRAAAGAFLVLAALLTACGSSGSSLPHAWCQPLIAQFHAKESRADYLNGLAATQKQGAPVAQLIADENKFVKDLEAAASSASGTAGFDALAAEPADSAKVKADLKELNSQCGQPADAYNGDNV